MLRMRTMWAFALAHIAFVATACAPTPEPNLPEPSLSTGCTPAVFSELPVPLHAQETSMWCWAASGQMVMGYLGTAVSQCTQANARTGATNCPCNQCGPNPQPNPACVTGGWPDFNRYGFDAVRTHNAAVSWATLQQELSNNPGCGDRPIAFSWAWSGGGGHVMVAIGYSSVSGTNYVSIKDPWAPCEGDARIVTYAAYVAGSGYTHWDDFYQIHRRP